MKSFSCLISDFITFVDVLDWYALKVEELQYQLHAKGKEVDTAASALGSALDEIKQLQVSSQKVDKCFCMGDLFHMIAADEPRSMSTSRHWHHVRTISVSSSSKCCSCQRERRPGPQSSRQGLGP